MRPVEFIKALGAAILIMILDIACAFLAVTAWSLLNPEVQTLSTTDPIVIQISSISTLICGPILFALIVRFFSRRRPDRNAWIFAVAVFGFYMLLDWGMVAFRGILDPQALIIAALKLAGALVGAWLARRGAAAA